MRYFRVPTLHRYKVKVSMDKGGKFSKYSKVCVRSPSKKMTHTCQKGGAHRDPSCFEILFDFLNTYKSRVSSTSTRVGLL